MIVSSQVELFHLERVGNVISVYKLKDALLVENNMQKMGN